MAESVGLALLVVLDRLSPAERVAFVLHDLFAVPFDEIAPVVDRSTVTTKKLASRARLRVRGEPPPAPEAPAARAARTEHAAVVEAFLAASQGGDLDTLVTLLAPDVVRRSDPDAIPAGMPTLVRGARAVADEAKAFTHLAHTAALALVDGELGIVAAPAGRLTTALRLTVEAGRITEIDVTGNPAALAALTLSLPDPRLTTARPVGPGTRVSGRRGG